MGASVGVVLGFTRQAEGQGWLGLGRVDGGVRVQLDGPILTRLLPQKQPLGSHSSIAKSPRGHP
jgi:hypothetical protein